MYTHGRNDHTGRLLTLMNLQKQLRNISFVELHLVSFNDFRDEVNEEIQMLLKGDYSHV